MAITDYPSTLSVGALFAKIIRRLPDFTQEMDFLSAVQLTIDICTKTLREAKSDLIKGDFTTTLTAAASFSTTQSYGLGARVLNTDPTGLIQNVEWCCTTANGPGQWNPANWSYPSYAQFTLPSTFRGFVDFPWLSTPIQKSIYPIPDISMKAYYILPSAPDYYELRYLTVTVYPTPDQSYTLNAEIYVNPTPLVDFTSYLPYGGLLDQAITEGVMLIGKNGLAITTEPKFREYMRDQISLVHHLRPAKTIVMAPPPTGRVRQWLY
jgi:hypothetical protein